MRKLEIYRACVMRCSPAPVVLSVVSLLLTTLVLVVKGDLPGTQIATPAPHIVKEHDQDAIARSQLPKEMSRAAIYRGLAPHGFTGDRSYLHAALLKAIEENRLRICVVGGSVPLGHGLKFPKVESWPARAKEALQNLTKPLTQPLLVDIVNLAIPGMSSYIREQTADEAFWLLLESCHITVVDSSVNDSEHTMPTDESESSWVLAEGGHLMRAMLQRLIFTNDGFSRGLLYFETFTDSLAHTDFPIHLPRDIFVAKAAQTATPRARKRRAKTPPRNDNTNLTPSALINKMREKKYNKKHNILSKVEDPPEPLPLRAICPLDVAQMLHWPALVAYQIPVLAWPAIVCRPDARLRLYDSFPHPTAVYHRHMGQVVAFALFELLLEALRLLPPLAASPPPLLSARRIHLVRQALQFEIESPPPPANSSHRLAWANYTATAVAGKVVQMAVKAELGNKTFLASNCEQNERLTLMTARHPESFLPVAKGDVWSFGEDMYGNDKPGWVANNGSSTFSLSLSSPVTEKIEQKKVPRRVPVFQKDSEIVFKFAVMRNILKVSVLKSSVKYMGTLACCVDCNSFKPVHQINTRWDEGESVELIQRIPLPPINTSSAIQNRLLRCRVSTGKKVKINSIVSC